MMNSDNSPNRPEKDGLQNGGSASQPESSRSGKRAWVDPELREFGSLSSVVKGISYTPNDGISNLTFHG